MPDDKLQNTNNSEEGKRLRREKLLKSQLLNLGVEMHPLYQEVHRLEHCDFEEQDVFFVNLSKIINKLFLLKPFKDNETLKKECEEVLLLLENKDCGYHFYTAV